jgi:hypothetical protein
VILELLKMFLAPMASLLGVLVITYHCFPVCICVFTFFSCICADHLKVGFSSCIWKWFSATTDFSWDQYLFHKLPTRSPQRENLHIKINNFSAKLNFLLYFLRFSFFFCFKCLNPNDGLVCDISAIPLNYILSPYIF